LVKNTSRLEVADKFWTGGKYLVVYHSFDNPEPGEFEEIVNYNAVRAITALTNYFSASSVDFDIISSREPNIDLETNLVLVGSSASNRITKRVTRDYSDKIRFSCYFDEAAMGGRCIIDNDENVRYTSDFVNEALAKDYGILTKIPSPYNKELDIVLLTGNYGFGTLAAALVAVNGLLLKGIDSRLNLRRPCQIVCSIPVFGPFASGQPVIVAHTSLPSGRP